MKSLSIHCGLCHSDLSVLNNEWGISQYPAILGHEVVGRVTAVGPNAKKFSGKYSHRTIKGGIGHNLPQEAPHAFAEAIVDVAEV